MIESMSEVKDVLQTITDLEQKLWYMYDKACAIVYTHMSKALICQKWEHSDFSRKGFTLRYEYKFPHTSNAVLPIFFRYEWLLMDDDMLEAKSTEYQAQKEALLLFLELQRSFRNTNSELELISHNIVGI